MDSSGTSAEIHARVSSVLEHRLSVYDVDDPLLRRLQPTHIVTQIQCEVCAVSLHDIHETLRGWPAPGPEVISLRAMTLDGMFRDVFRVAESLGVMEQAQRLNTAARRRIDAIVAAVPQGGRRVVGVEWLDPPMGTGNWTAELIELAGGIDLLSEAGQHARWTSWDEILAADPEILILFPCGFPIQKTQTEWNGRALPSFRGEVVIADGNQFFNRPGPRLVETLEILAEILHPDRFDFGHRGAHWKRWGAIASL